MVHGTTAGGETAGQSKVKNMIETMKTTFAIFCDSHARKANSI
jgi:hypothetical protein